MEIRLIQLLALALLTGCASTGAGEDAARVAFDTDVLPSTETSAELDGELTFSDWLSFAEAVKDAGRIVEGANVPGSEIERAEGYRYLLAMLGEAINEALYQADLENPQFRYHITKFKGEAMPSSDARYQRAEIDGAGVYRISGQLGNAAHITLQAYSGVGARETFDLESMMDDERRFDIVVGGELGEANRMVVSADAEMIQLREYFSDWDGAEFSRVAIERLDRGPRGLPTTAARIEKALARAVLPLGTRVPFWAGRMERIRATHDNEISAARTLGDVGLGGLYYGEGWFDLEEDEALVIEFERPVAVHWSYQLGNYWSQTIDWANFTSSTNGHQARVDSDGRVRLVVARVDPGVPNWLDTAGHREGVILYRYHKPESKPVPTTKLVKLAELRGNLPAETPVVSIVERAAQVERRRAHERRRWQP
jgi:hypothetical protein